MVTTNEPNIYETGVLDSNAEGNIVYTTLDAAINWIREIPFGPCRWVFPAAPLSSWPWPVPGMTFPASARK